MFCAEYLVDFKALLDIIHRLLYARPHQVMASNNNDLEKRLWEAADELRANSKLNSSEYSSPVLGLIFWFLSRICG